MAQGTDTDRILLAIDPGNEESALLTYCAVTALPVWWSKLANQEAIETVQGFARDGSATELHVEMVASYGMAVGASVFDTCVWIGRFIDRWNTTGLTPIQAQRVFRRDVKLHICGSARAKDANVRQALIDRYGGKEKAIGKKVTPGPLYGLSGDCWSALAVAVTASEADRG